MKLSNKVFIYTAATTALVGLLIIGYFMYLLPGLYTKYKEDSYMDSMEQIQLQAVRQGCASLRNQNTDIPTFTFVVPLSGNEIEVCSVYFNANVEIVHPKVIAFIDQLKLQVSQIKELEDTASFDSLDFDALTDLIDTSQIPALVQIRNIQYSDFKFANESSYSQIRTVGKNHFIMMAQATDAVNSYNTYFAFGEEKDVIYLTLGTALTPRLHELVPIVSASIPMILAVLACIVLGTASWFSKALAKPIETLAKQATQRNEKDGVVFKQQNRNDEFEILERALNTMHQDLQRTVQELHIQNKALQESKQKQELFMMNASHQLKTPIAGASLLVESMIHQVGKYKDRDVYLPKVQQELIKMKDMIEAMMDIFQEKSKELEIEEVMVHELVDHLVSRYQILYQAKELAVSKQLQECILLTDSAILTSIVENVILNAFQYTPEKQQIAIELTATSLCVCNHGSWIEEQLLPHIKEPFVRSIHTAQPGTGLGLYLVDTFASMLGYSCMVENTKQGVCITILF